MSESESEHAPVIRIVKKKVVHGGHHGGSWKVAYADFVTAMMAFFLVMWIISMDQATREKIEDYFNDPASATTSKAGISSLAAGGISPIATGFIGAMDGRTWGSLAQEAQEDRFKRVKDKLKQKLEQQKLGAKPDLSKLINQVEVKVTQAGLLVELTEAGEGTFFQSGSAQMPADARRVVGLVGAELGKLANPVVIEGHTDVVPYGRTGYSNWELSADRANAARRVMLDSGLRPEQVTEVRGYADRKLRDPAHPHSAVNRRVTIRVAFQIPNQRREPDDEHDTGERVGPSKKPFGINLAPLAADNPAAENTKSDKHESHGH